MLGGQHNPEHVRLLLETYKETRKKKKKKQAPHPNCCRKNEIVEHANKHAYITFSLGGEDGGTMPLSWTSLNPLQLLRQMGETTKYFFDFQAFEEYMKRVSHLSETPKLHGLNLYAIT